MSVEERSHARGAWERLLRQYAKHLERQSWVCEHPEQPERAEQADRSSRRFAELRDDLLEWSGADAGEFLDLLVAAYDAEQGEDA